MIIVKRALLAGGFGTGKGWIGDERPLEIAPVVNEHAQPVLTEHARRIQASHFRRRYPPSVASGTGTPVRGRASTSGLQQLTEEGTSNSGSDTDAAEYDSNKEGARQTSEMDISEEGERDVEANRTKEQMKMRRNSVYPVLTSEVTFGQTRFLITTMLTWRHRSSALSSLVSISICRAPSLQQSERMIGREERGLFFSIYFLYLILLVLICILLATFAPYR